MEEVKVDWILRVGEDEEVAPDKKPKPQHRNKGHHKFSVLKKEKESVYSQRLGKWISQGTCMICGTVGHFAGSEDCPLRRVESRRRKWKGKVSCTQRATRFAQWLLEHFDQETLQQTGVIDIAGGQGKFAYEFQINHSIPCTVIDPREMTFSENQKNHFQYRLDHPADYPPVPPGIGSSMEWPKQLQILFKDDFFEVPEQVELWNRSSLVVGMHPDEAAERIITFALKFEKNFVVLPCCVFPNSFPNRRTKEGLPVRFYEDFCDYLQTLDPTIQKTTLNIPGRNIVLWKRFN